MRICIITEAVLSSQSCDGFGQFIRKDMDRDEKDLLWSICKKQAHNWFHRNLIPWQLMEVFRTWGLDFMGCRTISDVPLLTFVDHLKKYMREAQNQVDREAAENIYYGIVQNDLMPKRRRYEQQAVNPDAIYRPAA